MRNEGERCGMKEGRREKEGFKEERKEGEG